MNPTDKLDGLEQIINWLSPGSAAHRKDKALAAIQQYCNRQVLAELELLVPEMTAEDYGPWVRNIILDRIAQFNTTIEEEEK